MAFQYNKEQKKQTYLIIVFAVVLLITFGIVWYGFIRKEEAPVIVSTTVGQKNVSINFGLFDSQDFKDLLPFPEIAPYPDKPGRPNPFVVY